MNVRRASTKLQRVTVAPALPDRDLHVGPQDWDALDWSGEVRIARDRAAGALPALRQDQVRTGLLERALTLGAAHRLGPHLGRPDVGRRLLAHVDALGEAGASPTALVAFAKGINLERPGALWTLTLLFGCLETPGVKEAFAHWIEGVERTTFASYRGVREVAEALEIQPNPAILDVVEGWLESRSEVLGAIAVEAPLAGERVADHISRLAGMEAPLVSVALERLFAERPELAATAGSKRPPWTDFRGHELSYEIARARILQGDLSPLHQLRAGQDRATAALDARAVDVFALAGDACDDDVLRDLLGAFASSPRLLRAIGRIGLPSLFPRLLAALDSELEADAHEALTTAMGPLAAEPTTAQEWERAIASVGHEATRLRGGQPHTPAAVLKEVRRPELSTEDVRVRADELLVKTGKPVRVSWTVFGETLESAIGELSKLVR